MRGALVALAVLIARIASAQPSPPPAPAPEPRVCLQGRPLPHCYAIGLFEIGFRYGSGSEGETAIVPISVGALFNQGRHQAWGATFGVVFYEHVYDRPSPDDKVEVGFAATLRYRRWIDDVAAYELSVGGGRNGALSEVALEFNDWFAVTAGAHTFPVDSRRFGGVAGGVGIRLGAQIAGALLDAFIH